MLPGLRPRAGGGVFVRAGLSGRRSRFRAGSSGGLSLCVCAVPFVALDDAFARNVIRVILVVLGRLAGGEIDLGGGGTLDAVAGEPWQLGWPAHRRRDGGRADMSQSVRLLAEQQAGGRRLRSGVECLVAETAVYTAERRDVHRGAGGQHVALNLYIALIAAGDGAGDTGGQLMLSPAVELAGRLGGRFVHDVDPAAEDDPAARHRLQVDSRRAATAVTTQSALDDHRLDMRRQFGPDLGPCVTEHRGAVVPHRFQYVAGNQILARGARFVVPTELRRTAFKLVRRESEGVPRAPPARQPTPSCCWH